MVSALLTTSAFGFTQNGHFELTKDAFYGSHRSDAVESLKAVSTIGDTGVAWTMSAPHFDNCAWDEGIVWMAEHHAKAVEAAIKYREDGYDEDDQQDIFNNIGYVLHGAEDFYAHSNWVETHHSGTIAELGDDTSKPSGWISGTWSASDIHLCAAGSPSHGELSKDSSHSSGHFEARNDAILEIQYQMKQFRKNLISAEGEIHAETTLEKLGLYTEKNKFSSAMFMPASSKLYFFKEDNRYTRYDFYDGYANHAAYITQYWDGLRPISSDVQAAFVASNEKGYFFKGDEYIRYDIVADEADSGYPKKIAGNWPGLWESDIDAIVQFPNSDKIYVFKGRRYMRYDLGKDKADKGYPQSIARYWRGLEPFSEGVDAAIVSPDGDKIFFFKGEYYISFDIEADKADEGYPKLISEHWEGL